MMRALLDINLLIALFDADHTFHDRAHGWYRKNRIHGWASCPLTENGVVRILSNPNYRPNAPLMPEEVISRLQDFSDRSDHFFWPDSISIRDGDRIDRSILLGPRQLTDVYLLALAVTNGGRLVTFDENIPANAVRGAGPDHLCVVG
jgi:toxin-antitoxin system PIN domain toxin